MQMGPALLPTPLSPARGHLVHVSIWFGQASPPASSPKRTWHSVSRSRPAAPSSRLPCGFRVSGAALFRGLLTDARAGIRLCFLACLRVCGNRGHLFRVQPAFLQSRDRHLGFGRSDTVSSKCKHSFLQLLPATITALNGCFASHLPQTIRFALRVSFAHIFSQDQRGQQPPYLCFEKTSLKSVPCGSSFQGFLVPKTVRNCAAIGVFARLARATYPLFPRSLVEGSGQLNSSSHLLEICGKLWRYLKCGRVLFEKSHFSNVTGLRHPFEATR